MDLAPNGIKNWSSRPLIDNVEPSFLNNVQQMRTATTTRRKKHSKSNEGREVKWTLPPDLNRTLSEDVPDPHVETWENILEASTENSENNTDDTDNNNDRIEELGS